MPGQQFPYENKTFLSIRDKFSKEKQYIYNVRNLTAVFGSNGIDTAADKNP
jgi:hypothetical protein